MRPTRDLVGWLTVLVAVSATGCDEPCQEPDVHGAGVEGDVCSTARDCQAGLTCIGTSFEADAHCTPVGALPGGADPGCLNNADEWIGHEADGVVPTSDDEDGCRRLVFVSGCNCVDAMVDAECVPAAPLYRQETWRSCNDCCWRLMSLWHDDEICGS